MIALLYTIITLVHSQNSNIPICSHSNTTIYSEDLTNMMLCDSVSLSDVTIQCSNLPSQNNSAHLDVNGTITLTDVTLNCYSIYLKADIMIINNLNSKISNQSQNEQIVLGENYIYLIATSNITIFNVDAVNYTMFLTSNQTIFTASQTITLSQIAVFSIEDILLNDIIFDLATISCKNQQQSSFQIMNKNQTIDEIFLDREYLQKQINNNSTKDFLTILSATNYTGIFITSQNLEITNGSQIIGSQIVLIAIGGDFYLDESSIINSTGMGCSYNSGLGYGPLSKLSGIQCQGNGGSNAGYGGVGFATFNQSSDSNSSQYFNISQSCLQQTNITRYQNKLYPYGYNLTPLLQGSGGGNSYQIQGQLQPSGGGAISIITFNKMIINGQLLADGLRGIETSLGSNIFTGAGSGGQINLYYPILQGGGVISAKGGDSADLFSAGEGAGGFIKLVLTNVFQLNNDTFFTGELNVSKGARQISDEQQQYSAQNGSIWEPWCPPFLQLNKYLQCEPCLTNQYKLTWVGRCQNCLYEETGKSPQTLADISGQTYCYNYTKCTNSSCQMSQALFGIYGVLCLFFMICLLVTGYMIRRGYKKRQMADDKVFDFEKATQEIVLKTIITKDLAENNTFQLGDLLYHAHRINIIGNNTFSSQWIMHPDPPENMVEVIDKDEYKNFIDRFNKLAKWKSSENIMLNIMGLLCYPLYWVIQTKIKKRKYKQIEEFITKTGIRFWKNIQLDQNHFAKIKITKSADYTLLYLDIFNYKNSDTKYLLLNCPYIVYLSGEGNFLRPFYICESDTFLVSLFFAVNQKKAIQEENRYKILDNLIEPSQRIYNSKRIHRFLKKFNKISMTLDYGSSSIQFYKNMMQLHDFLLKWNRQFFEKYNLKIELLVLQTPFDYNHNQQTITVLENKDSKKLKKFMVDIHNNVNFKKTIDVKFGVFIYNTLQDPEEVDVVLFNQKMSFTLDHSQSSMPITNHDSFEFDPEQLREQFILKDIRSPKTTNLTTNSSQFENQRTEVKQKNEIKCNLYAWRCMNYLRYLMMSHKFTLINKFNLTLILCIFVFLDYMITIAIFSNFLTSFTPVIAQYILFPYQFVVITSPVAGALWISSQSYGFLKVFLILNSMSMINLFINVIIQIALDAQEAKDAQDHKNYLIIILQVIDFIFKIIIICGGTRIISMNTKLNKLSQKT